MANPNIQVIETKILLRNDVLPNWRVSTIVLEQGEPAIEFNPGTLESKIKIGDGRRTFTELPYSTLTPTEIRQMISDGDKGDINSISLTSGSREGTLKLTVNGEVFDNIAVTGLGTAAFTNADEYATAEQGAKAERAMAFKGFTNVLPSLDCFTGDTYSVTADITIPALLSETGNIEVVVAGGIISLTENGKWAVMSSGVAKSAEALTRGISAELSGGATGIAEAANAGETMKVHVTEINTDYLVQGTKTLIFNGGNAAI